MSSLKGLIISQKSVLYANQRFKIESKSLGIDLAISNAPNTDTSALDPDFIIPRVGVIEVDSSYDRLAEYEQKNIFSLNPLSEIRIFKDKWLTYLWFLKNEIPTPPTNLAPWSDFQERRWVQKPRIGMKGFDIQEITPAIAAYLNSDFIVQELQLQANQEPIRSDIRVLVCGNDILSAMQRSSQNEDFRANAALGALCLPSELADLETDLIKKIIQNTSLNFYGIDFLRTLNGPRFLEINTSPGFEYFEKTTDVNVARAVLEFIKTKLQK